MRISIYKAKGMEVGNDCMKTGRINGGLNNVRKYEDDLMTKMEWVRSEDIIRL